MQPEQPQADNKRAWSTPSRVELTMRSTQGGAIANKYNFETPPQGNFPGCTPS